LELIFKEQTRANAEAIAVAPLARDPLRSSANSAGPIRPVGITPVPIMSGSARIENTPWAMPIRKTFGLRRNSQLKKKLPNDATATSAISGA
jgi:hypothetical protein